jgi:hypothetical protein
MFLIDIPFKVCQGRSNRSSSMTPHAFLLFLHTIAFVHFKKFEYLFEFIFEKALAPY